MTAVRPAYDIAILGSGFGGSLAALILRRLGWSVLLLERERHPRFAIGESSTPLADLILESIAQEYDLPQILPLAHYGTWKDQRGELACGLKRGFSFFEQRVGHKFQPDPEHRNELLFEASPADAVADTHWFREDVDAYLAEQAEEAGATHRQETRILSLQPTATKSGNKPPWQIVTQQQGREQTFKAEFLLDASGAGSAFQPESPSSEEPPFHTHSRALFSHFEAVRPWQEIYEANGGSTRDHPFQSDAAALHHIFPGGWMYVLRFDHGVTSAGFLLSPDHPHFTTNLGPEQLWQELLRQHPSIQAQFQNARPLRPLTFTGRLQRGLRRAAGNDWAALPHRAYALDPLYSSGIAHTLWSLVELIRALQEPLSARSQALQSYQQQVLDEAHLLDLLIAGSYQCFDRFDLFCNYSYLYFAAAIAAEERQRERGRKSGDRFLRFDDPHVRGSLETSFADQLQLHLKKKNSADGDLITAIQNRIAPFNTTSLGDPEHHNLYPYS